MGRLTHLFFGFAAGFAISACATGFPYRFYSLDAEKFEGFLRGPTPSDDVPLIRCKPTDDMKAPCTVVFTQEFLRMRADYLDLVFRLDACERGSIDNI